MPRCKHGEFNRREGDLPGSLNREAEEHDRKCPKGGGTFGHPGTLLGLFKVVCCAGCRKQVA